MKDSLGYPVLLVLFIVLWTLSALSLFDPGPSELRRLLAVDHLPPTGLMQLFRFSEVLDGLWDGLADKVGYVASFVLLSALLVYWKRFWIITVVHAIAISIIIVGLDLAMQSELDIHQRLDPITLPSIMLSMAMYSAVIFLPALLSMPVLFWLRAKRRPAEPA